MTPAETRRAIAKLGFDFLPRENREALLPVLFRLRSTERALVIASCPTRWRSVFELALALTLAPERRVGVVEAGQPSWEALLRARLGGDADPHPTVWVTRGLHGGRLAEGLAELNFARDEIFRPEMRLWLWVPPGALSTLPTDVPDLWRFRSAVLDLQPALVADLDLPTPMPGRVWPFSWERQGETDS